ncbi:hypothetical protein KQI52_15640 [bacterium]|nr:hypothetical protein [bacterium]
MNRRHIFTIALLPLLLFAYGCASVQTVVTEEAATPLQVQYDIQYVDNTTVGINLMVISPDLPRAQKQIEEDLFDVVMAVANDIPKDAILAQQSEFRSSLNNAFRASSDFGENSQVLVLGMTSGTWIAQR